MKIEDFSEETLQLFNNAKNNSSLIYSFIEKLVNADFDKEEIKTFIKQEFGSGFRATVNNIFKNL